MPLDFLISALVTLVVVVDPIGLAPTFLAVTSGLPDEARRQVALRAPVIAGTILTGTTLIGVRVNFAGPTTAIPTASLGASPASRRNKLTRTGCCASSAFRCRRSASPVACCCSRSLPRWCSACAWSDNPEPLSRRSRSMSATSRHSRSPRRYWPVRAPYGDHSARGPSAATRLPRDPHWRRCLGDRGVHYCVPLGCKGRPRPRHDGQSAAVAATRSVARGTRPAIRH
jgi:hypothetical protein